MNDNFKVMQDSLKEKHDEFMKKYGSLVSEEIGEQEYLRDKLYAKLSLVASAFKRAGICSSYSEADVRTVKDVFERSVAIVTTTGSTIFLLNSGNKMIVTDRVVTEDPFTRNIVMSWDNLSSAHKYYYKEYEDVLDDTFDWHEFSMEVLDAVHQVGFHSQSVAQKYVDRVFEEKNG